MEIIIPIGISGSGKSTLYNEKYSNYKIVCPDQIRLEITGNISDQSKNKEVFDIANDLVEQFIKQDIDFYYDATNVNTKYRKQFVKNVKSHSNVKVTYVVMICDIDESYKRIRKDIVDNKVRSNVPLDVLHRQYEMFEASMKSDFSEEGADEVIYVKYE